MPLKKQIEGNDKIVVNKRSMQQNTRNLEPVVHQISPTRLVQRFQLDPHSLKLQDILQLQRTIGNRASGLLLIQATQNTTHTRSRPIPQGSPVKGAIGTLVQRQEGLEQEEELYMRTAPAAVQGQEMEEEETIQGKFTLSQTLAQRQGDMGEAENRTDVMGTTALQLIQARREAMDSAKQRAPSLQRKAKPKGRRSKKTSVNNNPTPKRNAAKTDALTNIGQLERQIAINMRKWHIAARNVGSGYELAGTRHTNACKDAASQKALHEAILFGILTAASVGALSWLSTVAQEVHKSREVLINVLEDVVQSGVGEGIDVRQAAVAPSAKPVSGGYLSYQNNLLNHLDELMNNVTQYFIDVVKEIQAAPWSAWDRFSSEKQIEKHQAWLKQSRLSRGPTVPPKEKIADSLESDMWAQWSPGLIVKQTRYAGCSGRSYSAEEITDPGVPVEKRLNALGITSVAGIGENFGWFTTDSEVRKLRNWAQGHKPKKILDL